MRHVDIIGDDRQVIGRQPVRSQDDEVFDLVVIELDGAADAIGVRRHAGWYVEAEGRRDAGRLELLLSRRRKPKTGAVVLPSADGFLGFLALLLQQRGRAVALVRVAAGKQRVRNRPVALETLRLEVGRVRPTDFRPLIPLQAEPVHRFEDAGDHVIGRPLGVRVFDAKNERPAVAPREQPVEQRRARAADVEIASGRRGEANARPIHLGF